MKSIALPLLLVGIFTACGDTPAPTGPVGVAAPVEVTVSKNPRQPAPVEETFVLDWLCNFPVHFQLSGKMKQIDLPGGRTIFTHPGLSVVLTNLDNEKSVRLSITGAFHQTVNQNGDVVTVMTGRNLGWDPEAGFFLASGRFSYVIDAEGNLVQPLEGKGRLIDACELLAR